MTIKEGVVDVDPRSGLEILDEATCWELVRSEPVGRVIGSVAGRLEVWPVNFAVSDGSVFVRTADDSRLSKVAGSEIVFEVDSMSKQFRAGWSVMARGRLVELVDPFEVGQAELLQLQAWSVAGKPVWLRLTPDVIDGRRTSVTAGDIAD
jgi:uncharacterized protein